MDFLEIVLKAHSGLRWLALLAIVLAILKLLATWLGKKEFDKADRTLLRIAVGLLDVMMLLGLTLIISMYLQTDSLPRHQIEHGVTNIIAIVLAHLATKGGAKPGPIRARNAALYLILAVVLIAVAISRLPQEWTMTGM